MVSELDNVSVLFIGRRWWIFSLVVTVLFVKKPMKSLLLRAVLQC